MTMELQKKDAETTELQAPETKKTDKSSIKALMASPNVQKKFHQLLGKKAQGFMTSVLQVVSANAYLGKADPMSIFHAAATAATMDLPINNNLGFAYIIPYGNKAQFQMGYKGYIQLAQRTGQYETISCTPIFKGQLVEENPLTGFKFDFTINDSTEVIGYASYFKLLNGFEKTLYMTMAQMVSHAKKFSQSFKSGGGIWKDDFNSMALKTVLKALISKYGPLSIEMQRAIVTDQSVVKDFETNEVDYVDNMQEAVVIDPEEERADLMIADATEISHLEAIVRDVDLTEQQNKDVEKKMKKLTKESDGKK